MPSTDNQQDREAVARVALEEVTPAIATAFADNPCLIWSGEHRTWWRANGNGYTNRREYAGRYTIGDAFARTRHCGPEKAIAFERLTSDTERASPGAAEAHDETWAALDRLQEAEALYRKAHDLHGADDIRCGRAWDVMRRAGDHAREVCARNRLTPAPEQFAQPSPGAAEAMPIAWLYELFERKEVTLERCTKRISWTETPLYRSSFAASEAEWQPAETAPKNGTIVELMVDYTDGGGPLHDAIVACTIGWNSLSDTGEDEWQIVGWSWEQDCICAGSGKILAWRPSRLNAFDDGLPPLPTPEQPAQASEVERKTVARCIEIIREQREGFLSEQYATPQPIGSFNERFACDACADAIATEFGMGSEEQRALVGKPSHADEHRAALATHPSTGERA